MGKKESLEEFIARGGKVTRVPTQFKEETTRQVKGFQNLVAVPLTLDEAGVLYGHDGRARNERPDQPTKKSRLDLSALPDDLKKKFIKKLNAKIESDDE